MHLVGQTNNMSLKHLLFVFCLIKCSVSTEDTTNQPRTLPICYRNHADFNKCLLESAKIVRPLLEKGIPELDLAPISPYYIPAIRFEEYNDKSNYVYLMRNVNLTGLSQYTVTKIKFDVDRLKLVASFELPHLQFDANFSVNGEVLGVTTERDGLSRLTSVSIAAQFFFLVRVMNFVANTRGTIKQLLSLTMRNGETYLQPEFDLTKIHVGSLDYVQEDPDDEFDTICEYVWRKAVIDYEPFWKEYFKTVIEKVLVRIITEDLLLGIYRVPYDKLFPLAK